MSTALKYPLRQASQEIRCADCDSPMVLRQTKYGLMWGCSRYPDCKGCHGAHPDGRPLGKPANKETKAARVAAHAAFDPLWRGGEYFQKRFHAYSWLRRKMGMERDECHIGSMDIEQCARVVEFCREFSADPRGQMAEHEAYISARAGGAR